jgi:hypothetical protein
MDKNTVTVALAIIAAASAFADNRSSMTDLKTSVDAIEKRVVRIERNQTADRVAAHQEDDE